MKVSMSVLFKKVRLIISNIVDKNHLHELEMVERGVGLECLFPLIRRQWRGCAIVMKELD